MKEKETQNPKQVPGSKLSAEPDSGLQPMNHEIMTWAEVERLTHWATQAPQDVIFLNWMWIFTKLPEWFVSKMGV